MVQSNLPDILLLTGKLRIFGTIPVNECDDFAYTDTNSATIVPDLGRSEVRSSILLVASGLCLGDSKEPTLVTHHNQFC